jgi:hypothetical protein
VASCPGVTVLVGGGAVITTTPPGPTNDAKVALKGSFPLTPGVGGTWRAQAVVLNNIVGGGTVTVTAYAACA